jgi:hypothetical protein
MKQETRENDEDYHNQQFFGDDRDQNIRKKVFHHLCHVSISNVLYQDFSFQEIITI